MRWDESEVKPATPVAWHTPRPRQKNRLSRAAVLFSFFPAVCMDPAVGMDRAVGIIAGRGSDCAAARRSFQSTDDSCRPIVAGLISSQFLTKRTTQNWFGGGFLTHTPLPSKVGRRFFDEMRHDSPAAESCDLRRSFVTRGCINGYECDDQSSHSKVTNSNLSTDHDLRGLRRWTDRDAVGSPVVDRLPAGV